MKVAWISPFKKKCGISIYSDEYCRVLSETTYLQKVDIYNFFRYCEREVEKLNSFDIIHFQYETSFFLKSGNRKYVSFCRKIKKPIVITLHEVYDSFPGIFPRSHIKGKGLFLKIKEIIYDTRHPYQTVYSQHVAHNFFAKKILVHAHYQKEILIKKGIPEKMIATLPLPVKQLHDVKPTYRYSSETLNLGTLGFINQNYNHHLLFDVLENLTIPWKFTWIGGIRRADDNELYLSIQKEIINRKWKNKFIITGWVDEYSRTELLKKIDIYLALFSARTASSSLAVALSAYKIILSTSIPYTRELVGDHSVFTVASSDYRDVINKIHKLYAKYADSNLRKSLYRKIKKFNDLHSYEKLSSELLDIYRELVV